jgi:hypothetical protein
LQFEKAGTVKVELPVVAIGAPAPGVTTGGGTMMQGGSMQGGSMQGGSMMHEGGTMQQNKH